MPRFSYLAFDSRGNDANGIIDAASATDVARELREKGLFPTNIAEEATEPDSKEKAHPNLAAAKKTAEENPWRPKNIVLFQRHSVRPKTLMIFTRQLATLIHAGLPLLRGLDVLARQERDATLRNAIIRLGGSIEDGNTFSEALAQHPRIFNDLFVSMVKAGEIGGLLDLVLARLAEFQEKAQKLKNKIVAAMVYPSIVLLLAAGILVFLLLCIVPRFATIFHDMLGDKPLPVITLFVIDSSDFIQQHWIELLGALAVLAVAYRIMTRTRRGRLTMDHVKLHAPLFGDLVRKALISRFSRTLGTLVSSGVPILQALEITRETAGNSIMAREILKVHDSVKEGETIVQPMEASRAFPPMVVSMIDVGEETGQLPEMLLRVADVYDDEVDNCVAALTSLLEPVMIVILALVVGGIVIALFMPLISIISGLQQQS